MDHLDQLENKENLVLMAPMETRDQLALQAQSEHLELEVCKD